MAGEGVSWLHQAGFHCLVETWEPHSTWVVHSLEIVGAGEVIFTDSSNYQGLLSNALYFDLF